MYKSFLFEFDVSFIKESFLLDEIKGVLFKVLVKLLLFVYVEFIVSLFDGSYDKYFLCPLLLLLSFKLKLNLFSLSLLFLSLIIFKDIGFNTFDLF